MKKIVMVMVIAAIFAASLAAACPLPVDVKIQKVVTNNSKLSPALDASLETRLRSQLRTAFSCRGKSATTNKLGKDIVNVELVEIIREGIDATRVNVATDHGFFSARAGRGVYTNLSTREQFEYALEQIEEDISNAVCK